MKKRVSDYLLNVDFIKSAVSKMKRQTSNLKPHGRVEPLSVAKSADLPIQQA
jgi:hypothetical protein